MAARAAGVVEIKQDDDVETIKTNIDAAINGLPSTGGAVAVSGVKEEAGETLELTIPENVTVVWKAEYFADKYYEDGGEFILISLAGGGTFEVAAGGMIEAEVVSEAKKVTAVTIFGENVDVIVTGGAAEAIAGSGYLANARAIEVNNGTVTVTGGTAAATAESDSLANARAIEVNNGAATVAGGAAEGTAIIGERRGEDCSAEAAAIFIENGAATVTGGTVKALAKIDDDVGSSVAVAAAILVGDGTITASGGDVSAASVGGGSNIAAAVEVENGTITITGGTVGAAGKDGPVSIAVSIIESGVAACLQGACFDEFEIGKTGMIVEADSLDVPAGRNGTSAGLTTKASRGNASAIWKIEEGVTKILFTLDGKVMELVWA